MIETQSFRFAYPGAAQPAVRDLTFAVEQGEIFGFLGPSGAGKSTTQNVLVRLLEGGDFGPHLASGTVVGALAIGVAAAVFERRLLRRG